jgi:hypothetical protein
MSVLPPESEHSSRQATCPLSANSGHSPRSDIAVMAHPEWRINLKVFITRALPDPKLYEIEMWAAAMAVRIMRLRFAIPVAMMFLLSAFTQADLEKAKKAKDYFKDSYWRCLATEIVQKQPTNISVQDFSVFIKSACRQERGWFFKSLIDYMAMLHPDKADDYTLLASAANIAVAAAIDDAVKVFVDLRSGNKEK